MRMARFRERFKRAICQGQLSVARHTRLRASVPQEPPVMMQMLDISYI